MVGLDGRDGWAGGARARAVIRCVRFRLQAGVDISRKLEGCRSGHIGVEVVGAMLRQGSLDLWVWTESGLCGLMSLTLAAYIAQLLRKEIEIGIGLCANV